MALTIHTDSVPLRIDEHGAVRVGDSRVLLDIVIREFNNGAEPDAIASGYPTLDLADVLCTRFVNAEPITLAAARSVGDVLRYVKAGEPIHARYSHYM